MHEDSQEIEQQLAQAQRRLRAAQSAWSPIPTDGEWDECEAAHEEVLKLERALAQSKGEPYAVPCDFPVKWCTGAPLPFLLCNDYRTFLTFYVNQPDPDWDGTYVNVINPASAEPMPLCLVTFHRCLSAKLGHPNDEVQHGHSLWEHGLDSYRAQIVKNSPWIAEVAKINSVHHYDDPDRWALLNHYVFWFHDTTFECLANSYEYEVTNESMTELLDRVQKKLLE